MSEADAVIKVDRGFEPVLGTGRRGTLRGTSVRNHRAVAVARVAEEAAEAEEEEAAGHAAAAERD
jgi:hypothetical protein